MRVGICFFGEMGFIDRFMLQGLVRCVIIPLRKYNREDVDYSYFLHTFFHRDLFKYTETMTTFFPLSVMMFHDPHGVLTEKHPTKDKASFLESFSLYQVKKLWKQKEDLDIVVCVRLDTLFTKPLSENDVEMIVNYRSYLFLGENIEKSYLNFAIGAPDIMSVYADRFHHVFNNHHHDNSSLYLAQLRVEHNIKTSFVSIVFVRILQEGIVHPDDYNICPYLRDLIASSSTTIRMVRRKNSLK